MGGYRNKEIQQIPILLKLVVEMYFVFGVNKSPYFQSEYIISATFLSLVSDSEKEETGGQAMRGRNSLPHEDTAKLTFNSISKRTADAALIEIKIKAH